MLRKGDKAPGFQLADQDGEVAGVYVDVMHQGWLTALSAEDEIRKLLQEQKEHLRANAF